MTEPPETKFPERPECPPFCKCDDFLNPKPPPPLSPQKARLAWLAGDISR